MTMRQDSYLVDETPHQVGRRSSLVAHIVLFAKGMAMGAADLVPGVSGGTIAFITGIYPQLLAAIQALSGQVWRIAWQRGIVAAWRYADGTFLMTLGLGILLSIFSLAVTVEHLLMFYKQYLFAFFFGLILVSALLIGREVQWRHLNHYMLAGLGVALGGVLSVLHWQPADINAWSFFLAGSVAICAMILPGISGSFILLIMGMYEPVVTAIKQLAWAHLASLAMGCGVGLLSIVHLLSYAFRHFYQPTLALLIGFMLGSLPQVWPWQGPIMVSGHTGRQHQLMWPDTFAATLDKDPGVIFCILLMLLGVLLVWGLEYTNKRYKKYQQ